MIFGILQHCSVFNTSVISILNIFITSVRHLVIKSATRFFTCKIKQDHCIQMFVFKCPHQHPTTQFFTGRMPFLPPNQQHKLTEGRPWCSLQIKIANKYNACCCSSKSRTPSIFPFFNTLLQLILFSSLSRLVLLNKLC